MQFAQPDNLIAFLVLVPMLAAFVGYWIWKRRLIERVGDHDLLHAMAATTSSRRKVARAVLALVGTALLCVAVAQPQWGQTNRPIRRTGVDVVFAMDLSQSMMAQDVSPFRLQAAKDEIETTLQILEGDRVGLVVFTAISFVQTPLTVDYGAIRFYLDKLRTEQMPLGGTSLGRAVTDAVELLTGERVQGDATDEGIQMRRAKSQVIVLITDGEDHESDPLGAAALAREKNIKIVTVGFGSSKGEKIPVFKPSGELSGYKRDRNGEIVRTSLDEATLREMAETTGGTYIPYGGPNSVAHGLVDYINELEKSEIETLTKERYRERFGFFLAPALVLLLLSMLLGDRRRTKKSNVATVASVLALFLLVGSGCDRPFEDTLGSVDDGNELLEAGKFQEALDAYRKAETEIPGRPELHYDIGRALLGLQNWDDAADAFARALETNDPSLQFDSLYNLGLAHAGKEDWQNSWESFRDALVNAERSGLVDKARLKQARRNLEVAWLRLYPPCRKLEDAHEENDSPDKATALEQPTVEDATLCGLDDDWYVIRAMPGTRVSVTAKFRDVRENPDPDSVFLPKPADLQIALFDQRADAALVVDQGIADEPSERRTATRTIERFLVDDTMVSGETPFVLLKVGAAEHLEYQYDIEIVSIPPCGSLEEAYEDNDLPEEAKVLTAGPHELHSCPADEDWFAVELSMGDTLFVDLQVKPDAEREAPPALSFEVFDPDGVVIANAEAEGPFLTAGVRDVERDGRYLVHVFGATDDEQGPYQLDLYRYAPDCPVGDDRFEENDMANSASPLDPQQPVQRYLRACPQDADFFRIDYPEDAEEKRVHLGLANVSSPRAGQEPTQPPVFEFDLMTPSGDQILVAGETVEMPGDAEKPPVPVSKIINAPEIEGSSAFVRVVGDDEYYHIVQLDEPPPGDQDQQSDDKEQQEKDQQGDEQKENEEESGDQDQESDDQSEGQEDDQSGEGQEEQEPQSEDDPTSPEAQPNEEEEESKEEAPVPADQQEAAEMERIEDLLDALEQTDDNFQMRKALENMPGRFIEKDW